MLKQRLLFVVLSAVLAAPGFLQLHAQATVAPANAAPVTVGQSAVALNGPWKFRAGDSPKIEGSDARVWAQANYDDSGWQDYTVDPKHSELTAVQAIQFDAVPGWQQHGHPGYTGYGWYRIRLQTPPNIRSFGLMMPQSVDDAYEIYINGQKIGSFGKLDGPRIIYEPRPLVFRISGDFLRSGEPITVAVRCWSERYEGLPSQHNLNGGLRGVPLFGSSELLDVFQQDVSGRIWKDLWQRWLLTALYGAVGIISLFLFLFSRSQREYLWAGLSLTALALFTAQWVATQTNIPSHVSYVVGSFAEWIGFFALPLAAMHLLGVPRSLWRRTNYAVLAAILAHGFVAVGLRLGFLPPSTAMDRVVDVSFLLLLFAPALLLLAIAVDGLRTTGKKAWLPLAPGLLFACALIAQQANLWPRMSPGIDYYLYLSVPVAVLVVFLMRFTEQQRENAHMTSELEAARSIQSLLVPAVSPRTPGFSVESIYLPASQVGGDFFKVLPADDRSLLIVIGDVSGKGLKAAMTVSTIIGALLDRKERQPSQVLGHLNRVLHGQVSGFVTCAAALIEEDGAMTFANAGHLAPYRNGEEIAIESGLPLGILGEISYTETEYQLAPGDRLTFLSDGVVEATNGKRKLFGFERTKAISNHPVQAIAEAAKQFGQEDDITVVSVTRTPVLEPATA